MAKIQISELSPAGLDWFEDDESFLNELSDEQMVNLKGGNIENYQVSNNYNFQTRGVKNRQISGEPNLYIVEPVVVYL